MREHGSSREVSTPGIPTPTTAAHAARPHAAGVRPLVPVAARYCVGDVGGERPVGSALLRGPQRRLPRWGIRAEASRHRAARPTGVPRRGSPGEPAVREWVVGVADLGWDGRYRVEEYLDAGDEVVVVLQLKGEARGLPLDATVVHVVLFEDGKLRRVRQYLSREQALEAAGLRE
jgi:ketosteroid isomerase-like protein